MVIFTPSPQTPGHSNSHNKDFEFSLSIQNTGLDKENMEYICTTEWLNQCKRAMPSAVKIYSTVDKYIK